MEVQGAQGDTGRVHSSGRVVIVHVVRQLRTEQTCICSLAYTYLRASLPSSEKERLGVRRQRGHKFGELRSHGKRTRLVEGIPRPAVPRSSSVDFARASYCIPEC